MHGSQLVPHCPWIPGVLRNWQLASSSALGPFSFSLSSKSLPLREDSWSLSRWWMLDLPLPSLFFCLLSLSLTFPSILRFFFFCFFSLSLSKRVFHTTERIRTLHLYSRDTELKNKKPLHHSLLRLPSFSSTLIRPIKRASLLNSKLYYWLPSPMEEGRKRSLLQSLVAASCLLLLFSRKISAVDVPINGSLCATKCGTCPVVCSPPPPPPPPPPAKKSPPNPISPPPPHPYYYFYSSAAALKGSSFLMALLALSCMVVSLS